MSDDDESVPDVQSLLGTTLGRMRLARRAVVLDEQDAVPGEGEARRYVRQGELGKGNMGAVYEVVDSDLHRRLAMKVLRLPQDADESSEDSSRSDEMLARFMEEAQITGQLDHPGIVPLHELGMDDQGQVYFTMRMVRGRELTEVIALSRAEEEGWDLDAALNVLIKVGEAVGYANSKGVVHRDLKPANIMTGRFGEVYVMDWGVAKVRGRESSRGQLGESTPQTGALTRPVFVGGLADGESSALDTLSGMVVGTPPYMSPEQARGLDDAIDRRSDVYSIGAILYHLLTGHPPFLPPGIRASAEDVVMQLIEGGPPPVRAEAAHAPPELAAICDKAMSRNPDERYATMAEFNQELSAFLRGRPIRAYQVSTGARWVGILAKRPASSGVIVGLALALALGWLSQLGLANETAERETFDTAAQQARILDVTQKIYAETVLDGTGIEASHRFAKEKGRVPVPPALAQAISDELSASGSSLSARIFSESPFTFRLDGGARDAFEREALSAIQLDASKPFHRVIGGGADSVLRFAIPQVLGEACVSCHNAHPASPRDNWRVGDVRGVLAVSVPLAERREVARGRVLSRLAPAALGGAAAGIATWLSLRLISRRRS
jgi:serine/threonine-protein kinase